VISNESAAGPNPSGRSSGAKTSGDTNAVLCLLGVAAALFLPALKGYWLADDFSWVGQFSRYPWSGVPRLFAGDWSRAISQEYRPLWAVSFMIDLKLWGLHPIALHLTNLGLHLVACLLVWYLTATASRGDRVAALLALAFFAVAPVHAEAVAWISARGHILAPIFVMAAMVLLRRYEEIGRSRIYLGAVGCALAAFATQEVAVALPPLLLFGDVLDPPRRERRGIRRIAILHAPFWAILAGYLGFRYLRFGMLGRPGSFASLRGLVFEQLKGLKNVWLSPIRAVGASGSAFEAAVALLTAFVLVAALASAPAQSRSELARRLLFFGGLWPLVATAVLLGAGSPRHLYLASVGVAVALGLAGSQLWAQRPWFARAGSLGIGSLVAISAFGLAVSVAAYARSGRLSRSLAREIDRTLEAAERDPRAITVIVADYPERSVVFWDYFFPESLEPPFRSRRPPPGILPSFAPCHCPPEEWKTKHAVTLARLEAADTSTVRVVIWDAWRSEFVSRALTAAEFWQGGYAAPDGPLLRPLWPGSPAPVLP